MPIQCPVPKHQRPLSEYNELKNSFGFSWTLENSTLFFKKILVYLGAILLIVTCLVIVSFKWQYHPLESFLWVIFTSVLIFTLWILRLYLAWSYIYDRLMNATITYEESGWYDGQTWIKTNEVLLQDRLVGTYEVFPILQRLQALLYFFVPTIIITLCINSYLNI
jgi:hypothetical protein